MSDVHSTGALRQQPEAVDQDFDRLIRQIVQDELSLSSLPELGDHFVADLGCDSVDLLSLLMAIESEFNADISDEDAERIGTVQQAVDYCRARFQSAGQTASGSHQEARPDEQGEST